MQQQQLPRGQLQDQRRGPSTEAAVGVDQGAVRQLGEVLVGDRNQPFQLAAGRGAGSHYDTVSAFIK